MRYAVIADHGGLTHHEGEIDWDKVIGPEGHARVHLPELALSGFVNDCGHRFPERYPRNIVGSCVLAALGAGLLPYAGPVVITGWNPANTARGLLEIVPLPSPEYLTILHADVRRALDRHPVTSHHPKWADSIREFADFARTADTPTITIRNPS